MLVLTRKVGQQIRIGDDIVIKVLRQEGGRIRLGISAPPEVAVRRDELMPLDTPVWTNEETWVVTE